MPSIKLNIGRTKTKRIAIDSNIATKNNLVLTYKKSILHSHKDIKAATKTSAIMVAPEQSDANKINLATNYKKAVSKSRYDKKAYVQCSRSQVIHSSFNTDSTETSSVLTTEEVMFDTWGIESFTDLNIEKTRKSFTMNKQSALRTTRSIIEVKQPDCRESKSRNSWISSSFNADADNSSDDELDDSIYTLLEDQDGSHFRKLSLHDVLVEEELSFRKSFVCNDGDRSLD